MISAQTRNVQCLSTRSEYDTLTKDKLCYFVVIVLSFG